MAQPVLLLLGGFSVTFYLVTLLISVLVLYHFWFNSLRYAKLGNALPGPRPVPIFGNALLAVAQSPADLPDIALKCMKEYPDVEIGKLWLGPSLYVGVRNPRDVEFILNYNLDKPKEYDLFKPWLGDGLLISNGEKWKSHRKMIAPTFHAAILKTFIPIFNRNSFNIIKSLRKHLGEELDIHDYMSGLTVDILLETAMGVGNTQNKTHENAGYKYAKAVMDMCNILHQRHYKFWLRPDLIFNLTSLAKKQKEYLDIIHSLTRKTVEIKQSEYNERIKDVDYKSTYNAIVKQEKENAEKEASSDDKSKLKLDGNSYTKEHSVKDDLDILDENDVGEKRRLAFLDFMIEASKAKENKLSDEDIKEEVDTIMFEGHDTTAAASSFTMCMLGVHQEVQKKVVEEMQEIFQGSNRPVTFQDTLEMKYLERVILETLRIYPPVPLIARRVHNEIKLPSGYTLPANTTVVVFTFAIHRCHLYYKDPEVFNPDNFLPENCQRRDYYHFIPFSAGPRSCVGRKYAMLKLKVILANLIRNFKVTSNVKEEDFKLLGDIILKRADGFKIVLEDRNAFK